MSLCQDMTYISLSGAKENVVRMLNAVICNVGTGNVIVEGDSLDDINLKIKEEDGRYGLRIALPDLLDEECMKDRQLLEKKRIFEEKTEKHWADETGEMEIEPEEEMYEFEECSNARMIDILNVRECGEELQVNFELYESEYGYYADWLNWDEIVRIYGCNVMLDNDLYRNGEFEEFCGTIIFEQVDDCVKQTHIKPKLEVYEYSEEFDKLVKMDPGRYRERKIRCMEACIKELQSLVSAEKLKLELDRLSETDGRLVVPDGVTELPFFMWEYGKDLKSIHIPASVETINKYAISTSSLETIEISPDNPYFCADGNCILNKERAMLLIGCQGSFIPECVTSITESAFSGCAGLEEVIIPGSVRDINNYAFADCHNLRHVIIQEGVAKIGGMAFQGCTALEELAIPDSVTNIYAAAFRYCESLRKVVLSNSHSLTEIYEGTFEGCPCLKELIANFPDLMKDEKKRLEMEREEKKNDAGSQNEEDSDDSLPF